MRKFLLGVLVLGIAGLGVFWVVTRPGRLPEDALVGLVADPAHGERVFWAAGCASCHAAEGAKGEEKLKLGGGQKFATPFGTFLAPNISPHPEAGIGDWSALDLANAMKHGVSPAGAHYYPAFPYASYARASLQDIVDLHGYMLTLPEVDTASQPHDVGFPFSIRRLLGGWKFLYMDADWVVTGEFTPEEEHGRYLAEALGHCGECHTPRDALGGPDTARWLAGGPVPAGKGSFPNITPAKLTWSEPDIVEYLTSGFTPEFDSAGGHMALVVENFARLPEADRLAVAKYLKRVAPAE
jgi:mono/diheme cytochrome c family protein